MFEAILIAKRVVWGNMSLPSAAAWYASQSEAAFVDIRKACLHHQNTSSSNSAACDDAISAGEAAAIASGKLSAALTLSLVACIIFALSGPMLRIPQARMRRVGVAFCGSYAVGPACSSPPLYCCSH